MTRRPLRAAALLCCLASCAADMQAAREAQTRLVGLPNETLEDCAGVPTHRLRINASTEIVTYVFDSSSIDLLTREINAENASLPIAVIPGFNFNGLASAGSGYCHATFKLVNGVVSELHYTGDNTELLFWPDGVCARIVRSCLKLFPPPPPPPDYSVPGPPQHGIH